MRPELHILIISNANPVSLPMGGEFERQGVAVCTEWAGTDGSLAAMLEHESWDAALLDYDLPPAAFAEMFSLLRQRAPELPVILLADVIEEERAVELLKGHVCDVVFRDRLFRLPATLRNCMHEATQRRSRKRRSVALQQRRKQLCAMVEQVPVAIAMFDCEMNYLAVSRRWVEECGGGERELIGRNYYDVHPDASQQWRQIHQQALAGKKVGNDDESWVRPDGTQCWLRWAAHPWIDDDDAIGGIIVSAEDITEQKLAEKGLRQSEKKFATIFRHSPVGIGILHLADECFLDANGALLGIFGYDLHEIVGHRPSDLGMWGDTEQRQQILETFYATGEVSNELTKLRRKDGAVGEMLLSLIQLRVADEECALAVVVDISERVQMEKSLHERDAAFRAAIETAVDGFIAVDRNGAIIETNEAYLHQSGYSREELLGMNVAQLTVIQPEEVAVGLDEIVKKGHDVLESRHRAKDGRVWPIGLSVSYLDIAGGRFFGFIHDLTARRRMEEASRSQRAEMDFLLKQQVAAQTAAAFAHELNQPLEAISAYGAAAQRMLLGGVKEPQKLQRAVEGSVVQAQRAGKTLHELLAFLHHGEAPFEPIDINGVVEAAITTARGEGCSGFHSIVELEPELRPVLSNRIHLQKVLVNLICNGVEAMQEAGVPKAAITITVKTAAERNLAQVTIRDNGPGLDDTARDRIFTPFFTTKKRGIGLGLAISRSLIEASGGQLWLEPCDGPGATFHLTVPFVP